MIATSATSTGTSPATTAPNTSSSDQRRREAELQLSLLEVLLREGREVAVGGELARDGRLEPVRLGRVDDLDHLVDALLALAAEADRDDECASARRHQQPLAGRVVVRTGCTTPVASRSAASRSTLPRNAGLSKSTVFERITTSSLT